MELGRPSALWLLGLIPPIVFLYLLKNRRERRIVSSTFLWLSAERDRIARSPFQKLRAQTSLILQCLVVLALAVAFAEPTTTTSLPPGSHVALIVDTSASMAARETGGRTRLETAQDAAKKLIGELPREVAVLVIAAGREPHVVSPMGTDREAKLAAIESLDVRHEGGKLANSIALASERLSTLRGDRRIVVITDEVLESSQAPRRSIPIRLVTVGEKLDNVAIDRVEGRRSREASSGRELVEIFVAVSNFGRVRSERYVTLEERNTGRILSSRKSVLEPRERAVLVLSFQPQGVTTGDGLVVRLSPNDALSLDDTAFTLVPAGRRLSVAIVGHAPWIERALRADPEAEVFHFANESAAQKSRRFPLTVVAGKCPEDTSDGDWLIVDPPPGDCHSITVGEKLESPRITSWAELDPRFQFLTLEGVGFRQARALAGVSPASVLIQAGNYAIAADAAELDRHVTVIGADVAETDWPLQASFVVFVRNVAELARAGAFRDETSVTQTGVPLRIAVPRGAKKVTLDSEGQPTRSLDEQGGVVIAPPPKKAGYYEASWKFPSTGSRVVAVNFADEAESNLLDRSQAAAASVIDRDARATPLGYAWLAALVALLFVAADTWWDTRPRRIRRLAATREAAGGRT